MIALAVSALLSFQDPPLDALGNGSLQAPTAPVYRSLNAYDLTGVAVLDTSFLSLALTFGALPNPFGLEHGFSLPLVELYLSDTTVENGEEPQPGSAELLPGSGMSLPPSETWHYALRLTGDGARLFQGSAEGVSELTEPGAVHLSVEGTTLTVSTSLERPEGFRLYGVVGSYSPFTESGWQPLSVAPSPWAFSSEAQRVPVIDVLAEDQAAQAEAVNSRILPAVEVTPPAVSAPLNPWLPVMFGGLLVALVGLAARLRVRKAPADEPQTDEPQTDESPDIAPGAEPTPDILVLHATPPSVFNTAALAAPLLTDSEAANIPAEGRAPLELYDEDWLEQGEALWDEAHGSAALSSAEAERDPSVKPS